MAAGEPLATEPPAPAAGQSDSWSTQSIFSALKRTPGLHPAADGAMAKTGADGSSQATSRKVSGAVQHRDPAFGDKPAASSARGRVALTLRVDHDRHTRLRLLSAQTRRSSQDILLAALDNYIDHASQGLTFCGCLKPTPLCCKSG